MVQTPDDKHDANWMARNGGDAETLALARRMEITSRQADAELEAMRQLLKSESGLRVLAWLLGGDCADVLGPSFRPGADQDGRTTEYLEGMRAVGLKLLKRVEDADPRGFLTIQEWAYQRRVDFEKEMSNVG